MKIPDKLYDFLKWIAIIVIPSLVVLIQTVFPVWGIPHEKPIAVTIGAIGIFIGAVIGVSSISYNKQPNISNFTDDELFFDEDET